MIYFIIGAIIALTLMTPLGSELMRGYNSFMNYLYLRQAKGDSLEALKMHRETEEKVDDVFDDKVGKHGAGRVLGVGLTNRICELLFSKDFRTWWGVVFLKEKVVRK